MRSPVEQVERLLDTPAPWPILQAGAAVLARPAQPWEGQLDAESLRALVEGMRTTMLHAPGVGLAAPQVGVSLALAVAQDKGVKRKEDGGRQRRGLAFQVWLNPSYRRLGNDVALFDEGCLSVKGWSAVRPRAVRIEASFTDLHQRSHVIEMEGWNARIFQHETDHLSGELYVVGADMSTLTLDQ